MLSYFTSPTATRVMIDEKALHELLHGGVVQIKGYKKGKEVEIELALQDIGYSKIHELLCFTPA